MSEHQRHHDALAHIASVTEWTTDDPRERIAYLQQVAQEALQNDRHSEPAIDERYYPVTDLTDWEPLRNHIGDEEEMGNWMFMEASIHNGREWRYYKHSATRERLILAATGPTP